MVTRTSEATATTKSANQVKVNNKVDYKSTYYQSMEKIWQMIQDLRGGTEAMRKAATKWLPQEQKETPAEYARRREASFLFGAYDDAILRILSKPFSKQVVVKGLESCDPKIQALIQNMDGEGQDITQFSKTVLDAGIDYGFTNIFVNFPNTGGSQTIYEENALGIRASFMHLKPPDILGFHSVLQNGQRIITQLRFQTVTQEAAGKYGEEAVTRVWVITPTTYEVFKKTSNEKGGEWISEDSGTHTFGAVPLVICYINKKGFLEGRPALEQLAWKNIEHWQSASDQRAILRYARLPILAAIGFTQEEIDKGVEIGPGRIVNSANEAATLTYVEPGGAAIGHGRQDLMDIMDEMITLGLQPLVRKSGNQTATGQAIDEGKNICEAQTWIHEDETAIETAIELAAKWQNIQLPKDFAVQIFSDFSLSMRAAEDIRNLTIARAARQISHRTYLREIQRLGLLSDDINIDTELTDIEGEGGAGSFGGNALGNAGIQEPGQGQGGFGNGNINPGK